MTHEYLDFKEARNLFDMSILKYKLDYDLTDPNVKDYDLWNDFSDQIIAGEKVEGDCEDSAFTWGALAYRKFQVPRDKIFLVRGRSPLAFPGVAFDHAWAVIDGWVFDIWETGPVEVEMCKHMPTDWLCMADPLTARMAFPWF